MPGIFNILNKTKKSHSVYSVGGCDGVCGVGVFYGFVGGHGGGVLVGVMVVAVVGLEFTVIQHW